jgi:hypothetical protein
MVDVTRNGNDDDDDDGGQCPRDPTTRGGERGDEADQRAYTCFMPWREKNQGEIQYSNGINDTSKSKKIFFFLFDKILFRQEETCFKNSRARIS